MASLENLPNIHFDSISDFIIAEDAKPLGSGSFGVVRKAIHKMTNKLYAIKIIKLEYDTTESELLLLSRQISIHYRLNHPHIIKLWAVMHEKNHIYMVMEYAENGNLFGYLNKKGGISEHESCRLFYQVLEAIDYMHKNDVFHRDLKVPIDYMEPENILLDHQMNVKICDFGWVADDIHRKRTTFCGTYEYMAPEMINQIPYDYRVDIWALGILLYQLNHRKAPFPGETIETIKQRFEKGIYEIKRDAGQNFKILIVSLLQFDPSKRLSISEIKQSEWVVSNKKYFGDLAYLQLKNPTFTTHQQSWPKKFENMITTASSKHNTNNDLKENNRNYLLNNYMTNQKNPDQVASEDERKKKIRKKLKTMNEEDLYCMGSENFKANSRNHYDMVESHKLLQPINENVAYKGPNLAVGLANNGMAQKGTKKKKISSARGHTRTESSELLIKKFNKIVFHNNQNRSKAKDDRKKKHTPKRT